PKIMFTRRACSAIFAVVLAACAHSEDAAPNPGEAIRSEAQRILNNMKASAYSHKTKVDEASGIYEVDCSGLAVQILKKAAPAALKTVAHKPGGRALAHD